VSSPVLELTRAGLAGAGALYSICALENGLMAWTSHARERRRALDRTLFAAAAGLFCAIELVMTFGHGGTLSSYLNPLLYSVGAVSIIFYARSLDEFIGGGARTVQVVGVLGGLTAALGLASTGMLAVTGELPMTVAPVEDPNAINLAMTGGNLVRPSLLFVAVMGFGLLAQLTTLGGMWAGWATRRHRDGWILLGVTLSTTFLVIELGLLVIDPRHMVLLLFGANLPEVFRVTTVARQRMRTRLITEAHAATEAERERAEQLERSLEELAQAQVQLVQSEKLAAIGQIAGAVAHDVKSPLTIVSVSAQLLREEFEESHGAALDTRRIQEWSESLHRIQIGAERCTAVANRLLKFSRRGSGKRGPYDLKLATENTLSFAGPALTRRGVEWELDLPVELPVHGDEDRIGQVLLNLVMNAAEAVGGRGLIRCRGRALDNDVRLSIQDNGPGIPTDALESIFEPFFTTKADGTGLGLAICRGIVAEEGGRLEVASVPGEGATFTLTLPLRSD